jgi:hypothetical protein
MKRGGQVIYMGPLGHHSQLLIEYFEVVNSTFSSMWRGGGGKIPIFFFLKIEVKIGPYINTMN